MLVSEAETQASLGCWPPPWHSRTLKLEAYCRALGHIWAILDVALSESILCGSEEAALLTGLARSRLGAGRGRTQTQKIPITTVHLRRERWGWPAGSVSLSNLPGLSERRQCKGPNVSPPLWEPCTSPSTAICFSLVLENLAACHNFLTPLFWPEAFLATVHWQSHSPDPGDYKALCSWMWLSQNNTPSQPVVISAFCMGLLPVLNSSFFTPLVKCSSDA